MRKSLTMGRAIRFVALAFGLALLASCDPSPETVFTVTTTVDGSDAVPGDGICEMSAGLGDCSLRAAIDEVNAGTADPPAIVLPAGTYPITPGPDDDTNVSGDLDIGIDPAAAGQLRITGTDAVIDGQGASGGLDLRSGRLAVTRTAITNTTGHAVRAASGSRVALLLSSVHDNLGTGVHVDAGATGQVYASTISGNDGAGIVDGGVLSLGYATVTANGAGGIVGIGTGTAQGSIVADQAAGADCQTALTSLGHNIDGDGSCGLVASSDLPGPAGLSGLSLDPVPFHRPGPTSAAVDSVAVAPMVCGSGVGVIDQQLQPRPVGAGCDRGAVEAPDAHVVDVATDAPDAAPGDGACATGAGTCTLRAAIDEVEAGTARPIVIATGVDPTLSIVGTDDTNDAGDLDITTDVTITGSGATIDAATIDRTFHVLGGGDLILTGVTLTGGQAGTGGGVRVDLGATASVVDSTFADNVATDFEACAYTPNGLLGCGGEGGGGAIWSAGTTSVVGSTFVENRATGGGPCYTNPPPPFTPVSTCPFADGGAVRSSDPALTTVRNSTFDRNTVFHGRGGAVHGVTAKASTFVDNSTIGQASPMPVAHTVSNSKLSGSIVAGLAPSCSSNLGPISLGSNVATDDTCGGTASDEVVLDPLLGALEDNGGATATHLPWANSPLVDAIPAGTVGLCDGSNPADQRGIGRPSGAACDVGAVEGASALPAAAVSLVVDDPADAPDTDPGDRACVTAGGGCTLRAAIDEANFWGRFQNTITIADGVDPVLALAGAGETLNASGDLDLRADVTIEGNGATIDGAGLDRVLHIYPRPATPVAESGLRLVRLVDLTITDGAAGRGGGLLAGAGVRVTLDGVTVRANTAGISGGALASAGADVIIDGSVLEANQAHSGGAIAQDAGTLVVRDTTIADNVATDPAASAVGGGIDQRGGTLTIERSLFEDNQAASTAGAPRGGAIEQSNGTATVTNTTFAGNRAVGTIFSSGGAISARSNMDIRLTTVTGGSAVYGAVARYGIWPGPVTLTATAIDAPGTDCFGGPTSGGYNVSSDATCALTAAGDLQSTSSQLGALADNGGPTSSHLPGPSSPLRDRVPFAASPVCDGSTTDQRGTTRPLGLACDAGAVEDGGAPPASLDLTVDNPADAVDAATNDGVCDIGDGTCTLRAAIGQANAWPTDDRITIAPGVEPVLSIAGTGEDADATGDLDITDEVVIDGNGAVLDAAALDRVLHVRAGTTIVDLTITGGRLDTAPGYGGGILHTAGALDLTDLRVASNLLTAGNAAGAGLASTGGSVAITTSTFDDNVAWGGGSMGGAIYTEVDVDITASTITANVAASGSAVYTTFGDVDLTASTLTRNSARSIWASSSVVVTVAGTAIEALGGDACSNAGPIMVSGGYNIVGDTSCGFTGAGDQQGVDPTVASLADNGGPTPTQLPFAGSSVVDAIPAGTAGLCDASSPVDQRGVARPQGAACDVGAVEGEGSEPMEPIALIVDAATDAPDAEPGDGVCATTGDDCTLRAAVDEANRWPAADAITVGPGVDPVLGIAGANEGANRTGDLDVLDDVSIDGDGATVDAAGLDRAFDVRGASVSLQDIVVTGGQVTDAVGGGLLIYASDVQVSGATFESNDAHYGGAVHAYDGSTVAVSDSTFTANSADLEGGAINAPDLAVVRSTFSRNIAGRTAGAIFSRDLDVAGSTFDRNQAEEDGGAIAATSNAGVTITTSTFAANHAGGFGGAYAAYYQSDTRITGSTFTANDAGSGATVWRYDESTLLVGSSVLDNVGEECLVSHVTSLGYNVVADASCGSATGDQAGVLALLGPLTGNGGPTVTQLPYADSPAVNAIPAGTAGLCDATTPVDQRGVARPQGGACDAGAVEGAAAGPAVPLALTVDDAADVGDDAPGDGVCDTGTGVCTLRAAVDETNHWSTADTISIAAGIDPTMTIAGNQDNGNRSGDFDVAQPLIIHGGGATIDAGPVADRIFDVSGAGLVLDGITLTGGAGRRGGAIEATGSDVQLTQVTVTDSHAINSNGTGWGGGLFAQNGSVAVVDSTFEGNSSSANGGGIMVDSSDLVIDRSTIVANSSGNLGGGVAVTWGFDTPDGSTLAMTRSTVSQNSASSAGGAIAVYGSTATVTASTLAGNTAPYASAFWHDESFVASIRGSILVGTGASLCERITSQGYNLVSDASCAFSSTGDVQSSDPLLAALAANGGPTLTHLPGLTSPALDTIPAGTVGLCDASLPTDQRGAARPANGACDKGAVERQPGDP